MYEKYALERSMRLTTFSGWDLDEGEGLEIIPCPVRPNLMFKAARVSANEKFLDFEYAVG